MCETRHSVRLRLVRLDLVGFGLVRLGFCYYRFLIARFVCGRSKYQQYRTGFVCCVRDPFTYSRLGYVTRINVQ